MNKGFSLDKLIFSIIPNKLNGINYCDFCRRYTTFEVSLLLANWQRVIVTIFLEELVLLKCFD